ncbi:O-antigen ligase family protein [Vibrio crassostreae]|uniref:O-antigen ligase family protein n=1 Tax=Vibrio crassostreae TaxID=246167 RepID=UPI000F4A7457|nr:O-antigen ligase family protein [Vibrio crassostreae]NOH75357.1 O-antigen ligase family protein [Vibrio crassostreae]NOI52941.1 O-antigen ligase family protein [Vibrio crassostreae]ROR09648.1 O-antigen ligase [Vibrio crassostreae]CAK1798874.1 O-antigen ligase [Vibrio crassostreae]CAK2278285.1 O-antigen ligase [Vibrio crassostreae]
MPNLNLNLKKIIDCIILLPIIWLFSGFLIVPGADKSIVIIILISIIVAVGYYKLDNIKKNYKDPYILSLFVISIFNVLFYETIGFGSGELRSYLAVMLYLLVLPKDILNFKNLKWLLFIAASLSFLILTYNRYGLDIERGIRTVNPIPYSITLTLYAISALYLCVFKKSKISIVSYTLLVMGIFITETRGAIFPLIITSSFLIFLFFMNNKKIKVKHLVITIISLSIIFTASFEVIKNRTEVTLVEIQRLSDGDMNSSIGLRFQFWKAAQQLYTLSPIYGLGDSHADELKTLNQQGKVSDSVARYSPTHYHNQYIDKLVKTGILGFILLIIIQLIPCIVSFREKSKARILIYTLTMLITLACLTDTPMSQPFSLLPILILFYLFSKIRDKDSKNDIEMQFPLP